MKINLIATILSIITIGFTHGQSKPFDRLNFIIGEWEGQGSGFGNEKSSIQSSFIYAMNGKYIELLNESKFEPTAKNPTGEYHKDQGFISYDKSREKIVFRQFHIEGFVNQYVLQDSVSNDSLLVFETENIENFIPNGKTRWTIKKLSENEIQTVFDVYMPDKGYTCYGTNTLRKKQAFDGDLVPKVTGIGGIFFFSDNPLKTKTWYAENLGLEITQWGSSFEFRNAHRPDEINYLQWSPFKTGNSYFAPSKKEFMINYRVQNIDALVDILRANGVTILNEIEAYDYGKFVHIMDEEGNKIELWEPIDIVFTKMGGKTTK